MAKITIEELSGSLKEYLNGLGLTEAQVQELIDKFEDEKIGDISQLSTEEKGSLVGAINELFQSANNGKELIANAIGEPLDSNDTFSAMSNDINGLLSTFKTNMMNNGVTVESGDKFKQLIDKIATMVEEGSGKGIQYATGSMFTGEVLDVEFNSGNWEYIDITFNPELTFTPSRIIATFDRFDYSSETLTKISFDSLVSYDLSNKTHISNEGGVIDLYISDISTTGFKIYYTTYNHFVYSNLNWLALGIGEEDTTLRDSLANILEEEGVDVTEEDDMASLISKVEQKLDESSNYLLKNGGDPSIYTINYDYTSGNATATHKTNYLQFSTSGSNYQSAFAFFTLKEEIDLTDKTMIMFDLEINGTTKYTYFAYGVYKGTLDNNTTFVKGNKQNNKIDYESSLYEKRAKYIIDVSDCTGVHKIGLRIGTYGVYSSTLNLYNIEIV